MPANIRVTELTLKKFKKIDSVTIQLSPTNVLVGGNNSGKSSFLQGVHFSICAAIASRIVDRNTFGQGDLLYCPTKDFVSLRHGAGYLNQSNFGHLNIKGVIGDGPESDYNIKIYRGRNEGNVGCNRNGSYFFGNIITSSTDLFSIYVPGLAGIPQVEEFRTEAVIRRGVAGGDANLYLRNVVLLIYRKKKAPQLLRLMRKIFPSFCMFVSFRETSDVYISVSISLNGIYGRKTPIELIGTGVLQALQIFSYVTLFEPSLLLLDEPDAHLHPDNQSLLAIALEAISADTSTQVILSTHSRHLLDALQDEANFIWLQEGVVEEQGIGIDKLPLLLDLGALDTFDKLRGGEIKWVVLTEDSKISLVKNLLDVCDFDLDELVIYSYKSCTNIQSALALCEFIKDANEATFVIIHRDSDFMTSSEKDIVKQQIHVSGGIPFLTDGSDLESYFITPEHLSSLLDLRPVDIELWLNEIAVSCHNALLLSFSRKRDEIKYSMYRGRHDDCPSVADLIGNTIPLMQQQRLGKTMLKQIRKEMFLKFNKFVDPLQFSDALDCSELSDILESI